MVGNGPYGSTLYAHAVANLDYPFFSTDSLSKTHVLEGIRSTTKVRRMRPPRNVGGK